MRWEVPSMDCRTSFFDGTIYRTTLLRRWPLWLLYAGTLFVLLPMSLMDETLWGESAAVKLEVVRGAVTTGPWLSFLFAVTAAMAVFSWTFNSRSTGFMASLPPRREALYLSSLAAGLTGLLAADGVAFLAAVLAEAAYGQPDLSSLLDWLLVMVCCQVSFFGFAAFCATLTGHILALPAVCLVLQFTAVTVEMTVRHLLRYMVFGVGPTRWSDLALQRLSPLYYLCQDPGTRSMEFLTDPVTFQIQDVALKDAGLFAAYAAAGVVLAGLGLAIFRRRRMELAGDVVAVPVLKPVFRWCLALAAALGFAACVLALTFSGLKNAGIREVAVLGLTLLLGGFAGWFAADMLMKKTFRVFRLHWKGWLLFSGILLLLIVAARLDVTGYQRRVPAREEVTEVRLGGSIQSVTLRDPENIQAALALHESILSHRALHCQDIRGASTAVSFTYYRTDEQGRRQVILRRYYNLSTTLDQVNDFDSDISKLQELANVPEAIQDRKKLREEITPAAIQYAAVFETYTTGEEDPVFLELTSEEAYDLYTRCILPDLEEGTLGRVWLITGEDYARTVSNLQITISLVYTRPGSTSLERAQDVEYDFFYTVPTRDSWRTNRWLQAHGVKVRTLWDLQAGEDG